MSKDYIPHRDAESRLWAQNFGDLITAGAN
jgi:hypothetical protein